MKLLHLKQAVLSKRMGERFGTLHSDEVLSSCSFHEKKKVERDFKNATKEMQISHYLNSCPSPSQTHTEH